MQMTDAAPGIFPDVDEKEAFSSDFDAIKISIASPEKIRAWSHGEVTRAETINYRTLKPERGGLFCAQIFGPVSDWECLCGKYKRMKHRGVICDKCGVEVTQASVRRSRLGHIELACPVSHVWFFKVPPSRIGQVLDLTPRELERVLYYESYIVLDPGDVDIDLIRDQADSRSGNGKGAAGTGSGAATSGKDVTGESPPDDSDRSSASDPGGDVYEEDPPAEAPVLLSEYAAGLLQQLFAFAFEPVPDADPEAVLRVGDNDRTDPVRITKVRLGTLRKGQVVTEDQDRLLRRLFGRNDDEFWDLRGFEGRTYKADMGAEAAKRLLGEVDLEEAARELRVIMREDRSQQKRQKAAKRLKVVDDFRKSGNLPEWMILDVIPVLPPDLRPLVPLDGGRFATSDLNELYRKVINRNNRLKRLLELRAPDVIVRNEQRMLQEAVDALFDNGRRGRVLKGTNNRPLKSLSDTLKGKQGRFRQNLLGKRVDYSGRSVIVVGPELEVHQCGLPKKMALELFKPFLFNRLEHEGLAATIKQARELVDEQRPEVWDFLEEVISEHSVLLNRAPTLHRLGIQAFEPVLVEGKAIRIHPLVCSAFNADFDGDQMAVHVPLSPEAQVEAALLMRSSRNILSPAHGGPLAVPTQDMVLGIYYLTKPQVNAPESVRAFASVEDVILARDAGEITTLSPIEIQHTGEVLETHDSQDLLRIEPVSVDRQRIRTTVGRAIFNDHLPEGMPFVNGLLKKKGLQNLIRLAYLRFGLEKTGPLLDALKELGFEYATRSGSSIGLGDLVVPSNKAQLVEDAKTAVAQVDEQYQQGAITKGERYNKVIDVWSNATNRVAANMLETLQERERSTGLFSPLWMMVDSGARGSEKQIRQLAGMRGLMAKTTGEIIETPITSNFREGLTVIQYFISTNGARKGLADTALRTADAGYLTRRLADVAQDVIITERDCGTTKGINAEGIVEAGEVIEPLGERIVGRVSLEEVKHFRGDVIVEAGQEITEEIAAAIEGSGIQSVKIRSVLTCDTRRGVCAMCYGRNLATGRIVDLGEAVGIIAAQSIGEPGTQLTMRTFHIGGTASVFEKSAVQARHDGTVGYSEQLRTVQDRHGDWVVISRSGAVEIRDDEGNTVESHPVEYGARIQVADGGAVTPFQPIVELDPYSFSILAEEHGRVEFKDIVADVTMDQEVDPVTFRSRKVIIPSQDEKYEPRIAIHPASSGARAESSFAADDVDLGAEPALLEFRAGAGGTDAESVTHADGVWTANVQGRHRFVLSAEISSDLRESEERSAAATGDVTDVSPLEPSESRNESDAAAVAGSAESPPEDSESRNESDAATGDVTGTSPPEASENVGERDAVAPTVGFEQSGDGGETWAPFGSPMSVGPGASERLEAAEMVSVGPDVGVRFRLSLIPSSTRDVDGSDGGEADVFEVRATDVVARVEQRPESRAYLMPARAHLEVEDGDAVAPGDILARIPRETTKTKDITGGLPRVVELFEARAPKEPAIISIVAGRLEYGEIRKGKRVIRVYPVASEDGDGASTARASASDRAQKPTVEVGGWRWDPERGCWYRDDVKRDLHIRVRDGEEVQAGEALMDGPQNPHSILAVLGPGELQRYLINEIQEVYRLQGVVVDDKHIEVIISRMMRWIRVTDVGDTEFISEATVDRHEFDRANDKVRQEGGQEAEGEPVLLGLTKASLATDSFISAASFQETTKVLTDASLRGKMDSLLGLKENVIMGRLIPAGTGFSEHRRFVLPEEMHSTGQSFHRPGASLPDPEFAEVRYD